LKYYGERFVDKSIVIGGHAHACDKITCGLKNLAQANPRANWTNVRKDYDRMHFDAVRLHQFWEKIDIEDEFFVKTVEWASEKELPVFVYVRNLLRMEK